MVEILPCENHSSTGSSANFCMTLNWTRIIPSRKTLIIGPCFPRFMDCGKDKSRIHTRFTNNQVEADVTCDDSCMLRTKQDNHDESKTLTNSVPIQLYIFRKIWWILLPKKITSEWENNPAKHNVEKWKKNRVQRKIFHLISKRRWQTGSSCHGKQRMRTCIIRQ